MENDSLATAGQMQYALDVVVAQIGACVEQYGATGAATVSYDVDSINQLAPIKAPPECIASLSRASAASVPSVYRFATLRGHL